MARIVRVATNHIAGIVPDPHRSLTWTGSASSSNILTPRTSARRNSSPSSGSGDDPSFTVRRSFGKSIVAPVQPLLPPQLRFPKPRTYWTA